MGLLTDIKKKWNGTAPSGLEGSRARSTSVPRGRQADAAKVQRQPRPQGLDVSSESQDSGVVLVHKDSNMTMTTVAENGCPNCAAAAVARSRSTLARPSMERMKEFSGPKQQPPPPQRGNAVEAGQDHSRPGTGYSNHSGVPQAQQQHNHNHHPPHYDPGFSSRPVSWGRRATTENVNQDVPPGYTRPVTPPYSIRSEQTGWNSGQQYSNMYGNRIPGPASHDGDFSQGSTNWRRATSSHFNYDSDPRQPRHHANGSQSSYAPSEAGSNHPRNCSKNMENSAYEAGYRDAIARLKADADRW